MIDMKKVEKLKHQYPSGTVVELESMDDSYHPIPPGTIGEVDCVDDAGTIHVKWQNGCILGLIPEIDKFKVIRREDGSKE